MYASSKMVDHVAPLRGFRAPLADSRPGMGGLEDCESLFPHLKNRCVITEKSLARHFSSNQTAI